jgi:hypothetical protein
METICKSYFLFIKKLNRLQQDSRLSFRFPAVPVVGFKLQQRLQ